MNISQIEFQGTEKEELEAIVKRIPVTVRDIPLNCWGLDTKGIIVIEPQDRQESLGQVEMVAPKAGELTIYRIESKETRALLYLEQPQGMYKKIQIQWRIPRWERETS